jgi:hypothetical protein
MDSRKEIGKSQIRGYGFSLCIELLQTDNLKSGNFRGMVDGKDVV